MTAFKEMIIKTKKLQAFFYWLVLSAIIICGFYVKGIALPITIIFISGITTYYLYVMGVYVKNKLLEINAENNNILKNNVADLSEKINSVSQKLNDDMDAHYDEIKANISQLKEMIDDQIARVSIVIEKQTDIINTFSEETAKQTSAMIDRCYNQLSISQTDIKMELIKMFSMLGDSINFQSNGIIQQITRNTDSLRELQNHNIIDMKEHTKILLQETKTSVFDVLDKKVDLVSNHIDDSSKTAISKLSKLAEEIQSQKTSLLKELDRYTNEIIHCIMTGLGNYSEKLLNAADENSNSIEKRIEGMATKIISFSKIVTDQVECTKLELNKVHTEINLLEQSSRVSQKSNLDALKKQEQIVGDIQAVTSQLNNIRLLINSVKLSSDVKTDRKGNLEIIEDKENNLKISNSYEGDRVKKSEMYSSGKLKYLVEYDKQGKMNYSKNYNLNGDILTEIYYYPNEQVKERIEWTKQNGQSMKITTRFDEKGNKK